MGGDKQDDPEKSGAEGPEFDYDGSRSGWTVPGGLPLVRLPKRDEWVLLRRHPVSGDFGGPGGYGRRYEWAPSQETLAAVETDVVPLRSTDRAAVAVHKIKVACLREVIAGGGATHHAPESDPRALRVAWLVAARAGAGFVAPSELETLPDAGRDLSCRSAAEMTVRIEDLLDHVADHVEARGFSEPLEEVWVALHEMRVWVEDHRQEKCGPGRPVGGGLRENVLWVTSQLVGLYGLSREGALKLVQAWLEAGGRDVTDRGLRKMISDREGFWNGVVGLWRLQASFLENDGASEAGDWVDVKTAARIVEKAPQTIRRWIRSHEFRVGDFRRGPHGWEIRRSALEARRAGEKAGDG